MNHDAVRNAYPNIITIAGYGNFFDIDMNPVVAEMSVIEQEAERMEAEAIAKEEAREAIRASALQKLVDNVGLTVEEVEEFLKVEL
jgi:hypothetical protein